MAFAAFLAVATPVAADQLYSISGNDVYRIGSDLPSTQIDYSGSQRLTEQREGKSTRYRAEVRYTRTDNGESVSVNGSFVQVLMPDGSFRDRDDNDPDFLTILNQPFAIVLDQTTLNDIRTMHGSVPFQATSPLGGATLSGYLLPSTGGGIDGNPAIGIRFEANGPMTGALPGHPGTTISGRIRMDGTAYYSAQSALLLALNATLTITGKVHNEQSIIPVKIVYERYIRANRSAR